MKPNTVVLTNNCDLTRDHANKKITVNTASLMQFLCQKQQFERLHCSKDYKTRSHIHFLSSANTN